MDCKLFLDMIIEEEVEDFTRRKVATLGIVLIFSH